MPRIDCHVPVRVRVTGRPTEADLARLEDTVARAVADRLIAAERAIAANRRAPHGGRPATGRPAVEVPGRIPSYGDGGRPVAVPVRERPDPVRDAVARISGLLATGLFDWQVTDSEATAAFAVLRGLRPLEQLRVRQLLTQSGRWRTLLTALPARDRAELAELEFRLGPQTGPLTAGDRVELRVRAGTHDQPDLRGVFPVADNGIAARLLGLTPVVGLWPAEAATTLARAYRDADLFTEPVVVSLAVVARGPLYAPRHGDVTTPEWVVSAPVPPRSPHDVPTTATPPPSTAPVLGGPTPPSGTASAPAPIRPAVAVPHLPTPTSGSTTDAAALERVLTYIRTQVFAADDQSHRAEDNEHGKGFLVTPSAAEHDARRRLVDAYLTDLGHRMAQPGFRFAGPEADFTAWLHEHPDLSRSLLLAQARPEVDQYDAPVRLPEWQTAIELGVGLLPVVGNIVAGYEIIGGQDMFGHQLSTVDRAVQVASVFLPVAGRIFRFGRAGVTVARIAREYRLTEAEAEALFRAAAGVAPGTRNAALLAAAAADVKAGRSITDPRRIEELHGVLTDMGLTQRRPTLNQLQRGAASRSQAEGIERRAAELTVSAGEDETRAAWIEATKPERAARIRHNAALRRQEAEHLRASADALRAEAETYESGARSATADLPGPEDLPDGAEEFARRLTTEHAVSIPLAAAERDATLLPRLTRPLMRGTHGGRVVYRVEGPGNRQLLTITPTGDVRIAHATIHLNFGSEERAFEFLAKGTKHEPGTRIVAFEVQEDWVRAVRSAAIPEHRTAPLAGRQPRLVDVTYADDQLEIPAGLVDELQRFVIPGSGRVIHLVP